MLMRNYLLLDLSSKDPVNQHVSDTKERTSRRAKRKFRTILWGWAKWWQQSWNQGSRLEIWETWRTMMRVEIGGRGATKGGTVSGGTLKTFGESWEWHLGLCSSVLCFSLLQVRYFYWITIYFLYPNTMFILVFKYDQSRLFWWSTF